MKKFRILSVVTCILLVLAFAACDQNGTSGQTTPDTTAETIADATTAEATTEAPATEEPTAESTEEQTTEPETESETEAETETETEPPYGGRDDFAEDDPNNPYLNLIKVGTSMDGKTDCYDGRYDFGFPVCTLNNVEFTCVQDAIDAAQELGGGIVKMIASTNVCLYLHIPNDGNFYRVNFNWHNVDFVMDHGAIYDDCKDKNGTHGYAYYSDLFKLDEYNNLTGTYVWILSFMEGLTPGHHMITDEPAEDNLFFYGYEKTREVFEWPGLPFGEILP